MTSKHDRKWQAINYEYSVDMSDEESEEIEEGLNVWEYDELRFIGIVLI